MNKIRAARTKVIERLKANMQKHEQIHDSAVAGWKIELQSEVMRERVRINSMLDGVESGKLNPEELSYSDLRADFTSRPKSHCSDYESAIARLEMYPDDDPGVELTQEQFDAWVMDEWTWTDRFEKETRSLISKMAKHAIAQE